MAVEPIDAGRNLREMRIEIGRFNFASIFRELHDLTDRIDQETVRFALEFDSDGQRRSLAVARRQSKPTAHVDEDRLYGEIGRLKMELDWLKKKSGL